MSARRVLIVGNSGSGKSTLAKQLSARDGLVQGFTGDKQELTDPEGWRCV